jgi:hypothetical protein
MFSTYYKSSQSTILKLLRSITASTKFAKTNHVEVGLYF